MNSIAGVIEALVARMANDEQKARSAFAAARAEQEKIVEAQPDFGPSVVRARSDRCRAEAGKRKRCAKGRRALTLLPVEDDALVGGYLREYFAVIAAWAGREGSRRPKQLAQSRSVHRAPSRYGELKLMPWWD